MGPFIFQLLARPTLPRNLLLYVSMSNITSPTHCLDTTLTRLPLTVTRVRKVASTDPCLVFVVGAGIEPAELIPGALIDVYLIPLSVCSIIPTFPTL